MKEITYKVTYEGDRTMPSRAWPRGVLVGESPDPELIRVQARDINSGYSKALKRAREALGNGYRREIVRIEFWEVH
jgi:hypothetical protein